MPPVFRFFWRRENAESLKEGRFEIARLNAAIGKSPLLVKK
jgi:hypothetical protein